MKKHRFSTLSRLFSPGFVLMSVMIGGGFVTGREIVQYGGRFGAAGWVVGLTIAAAFSLLCMLAFEIARRYQAYDYRSHLQIYAGRLSLLFDVVYLLLSLLVLAVMASAIGNILLITLGAPYYVGVGLIIVISALLNFYGQRLVEKCAVWGALALYVGYIIFALLAIRGREVNLLRVFIEGDTSFVAEPLRLGALLWVGILYVSYNVQSITTAFFTCARLKSRRESFIAGALAGLIVLLPWALTYLALMAFYPQAEVLNAGVPWLAMMSEVSPAVVAAFGLLAGWTLVATTVGVMNAITNRIDGQLKSLRRPPLSATARAVITLGFLGGAVILSRFGIIALVDKGYSSMSFGMILAFVLPLLTVGVYRVFGRGGKAG